MLKCGIVISNLKSIHLQIFERSCCRINSVKMKTNTRIECDFLGSKFITTVFYI